MSQKQVMPKSEDLSRSLEINAIWTFDTEFATIFNKSCTYITFKSAVKHIYIDLEKAYDTWQYGIMRDLNDFGLKIRLRLFYIWVSQEVVSSLP